jgi:hypothetical protein
MLSNQGVVSEQWIENDMEGSCRGLTVRYYPSICLKGLRKTTKNSVRIACLWAEIWTWDLLNTKRRVNCLTTMFGMINVATKEFLNESLPHRTAFLDSVLCSWVWELLQGFCEVLIPVIRNVTTSCWSTERLSCSNTFHSKRYTKITLHFFEVSCYR